MEKQSVYGVGFIKSRKNSDWVDMRKDEMRLIADNHGVKLVGIIVDDSSGMDIDRAAINEVKLLMEIEDVSALLIRSVDDLSRNARDVKKFLKDAFEDGVSVAEVDYGFRIVNIPTDDPCDQDDIQACSLNLKGGK